MFTFDYWRGRAMKGDDFATGHMWSALANAVERKELTESQWLLLVELVTAIANGKDDSLRKVANRALQLGRRPGRKPRYLVEADQISLAQDVFDRVGVAGGRELDEACEAVLIASRGGSSDPDTPPDLRALKKAYRTHLPHFVMLQNLSRENDAT